MEKFILADGTAIRIGDTGTPDSESTGAEGEVPTVVLLHGFLENLNVWDELSGLLQPHARVIAPDLPGHGISEVKGEVHTMEFLADVVYAALKELGVGKFTLVGHSMGGYVALALAEKLTATVPQNGSTEPTLENLILFSSGPDADSPERREAREREIAVITGGKKELLSRTTPPKRFAPENRVKMADEIEDISELIMLTEDEGIIALLRGMQQRPDRNEVLQKLQKQKFPVLFIFGRHDEYFPPEATDRIIAAHPGAQTAWLERSGHNGFTEEPQKSAETILKFIKKR